MRPLWLALALCTGCRYEATSVQRHEPECVAPDMPRQCFCDDGSRGEAACSGPLEGVCECWGQPPGGDVAEVVTSGRHTCVLLGDGRVACFGRGEHGQLGATGRADSDVPLYVALDERVTRLAVGHAHTCVTSSEQRVLCFGDNTRGQLGVGSTRASPLPAASLFDGAGGLFAAGAYGCAVGADGAVRCAGDNTFEQLGVTRTSAAFESTPVRVPRLPAASSLSLSPSHACALGEDARVYCWGRGSEHQLGDDVPGTRATPAAVEGLPDAVQVAAGGAFSCALGEDARVRCFGDNARGQLGDGQRESSAAPALVRGLPETTVQIAAGSGHACALSQQGEVYCWGDNSHGQLGDPEVSETRTARRVPDLPTTAALSAGGDVTCAMLLAGEPRCFGDNGAGQLGDGSTVDRARPARIRWLGLRL